MTRRESFYGFDMTDSEVGPGEHHHLAIEVKHIFERIATEADEGNEEIFLAPELEHAVRRLLVDPNQSSLNHLLDVSPVLIDSVQELRALLDMVAGSTAREHELKTPVSRLVFEEINFMLRAGIFRLLMDKYEAHLEGQSALLCGAILESAMLEQKASADVQRYGLENEIFVSQQAHQLHTDKELSFAMSVLYCYTLAVLGPTDWNRSSALTKRATDLHIWLNPISDIFLSPDVGHSTQLLRDYALKLMNGEA